MAVLSTLAGVSAVGSLLFDLFGGDEEAEKSAELRREEMQEQSARLRSEIRAQERIKGRELRQRGVLGAPKMLQEQLNFKDRLNQRSVADLIKPFRRG